MYGLIREDTLCNLGIRFCPFDFHRVDSYERESGIVYEDKIRDIYIPKAGDTHRGFFRSRRKM